MNDIFVVPLENSSAFGIIDAADAEKVMQHKWVLTSFGYIKSSLQIISGRREIFLHNYILDILGIDHKNQIKHDNRRGNLRKACQSFNVANQPKCLRKTSSKYKGGVWRQNRSKWQTKIMKDGKIYCVGLYTNEIEAAKAYNKKAIELFGEFACLNDV